MLALSEEIVYGLKHPECGRGDKLIISQLPMKKRPRLAKAFGTQSWGLHVIMGFSYRKFLWWFLSCLVLCAIFAALWLHFVNDTQVTTALAPPGIILTLLTMAMAVAQKSEDAWHPADRKLPEPKEKRVRSRITDVSPSEETIGEYGDLSTLSASTAESTQSRPIRGIPNFSRRHVHISKTEE